MNKFTVILRTNERSYIGIKISYRILFEILKIAVAGIYRWKSRNEMRSSKTLVYTEQHTIIARNDKLDYL